MESRPNQFATDEARVKFLMSYMLGKPLEWVSCLRKNNSPILNNYESFVRNLKSNFGDYTSEAIVANSKLCSLRQRKLGHAFEYIAEFQRIAQYSNFNENAKVYMFIKGLKQPLREKLAMVQPNPTSLAQVSTTILNIESLSKRNDQVEYYNSYEKEDPMEIDLYRIKRGPNDVKYNTKTRNYIENQRDTSKEKKKGVCFRCKQPGQMCFNCPNKIKPKNLRMLCKGKEIVEDEADESTGMRRIRKLDQFNDYYSLREIRRDEKQSTKTNILDFYIKTNEFDESKIKVLIDSGSDINCIHPDVVKKLGIHTEKIGKPFSVSGLGHGILTVSKETEKCILRFKNHLEIIQLNVLRIPDVDVILGLPWINKHSPNNYHDSSKIAFSSGFCARHCNNGKRKRNNKKKQSMKNKMLLLEDELRGSKENPLNNKPTSSTVHYAWDSESDFESEPEPYFKGRFVRTINDVDDSDSDLDDKFMLDSISDSEFEDNLVSDSDSNSKDLDNSCIKKNSLLYMNCEFF